MEAREERHDGAGGSVTRLPWGRFTRNFVVQGTAAEWALCWLAELRNRLCRLGGTGGPERRPHLVFFLHDEVVVHTPEHLAGDVVHEVPRAADDAGRLLFGGFPSTSRSTSPSCGRGPTPREIDTPVAASDRSQWVACGYRRRCRQPRGTRLEALGTVTVPRVGIHSASGRRRPEPLPEEGS